MSKKRILMIASCGGHWVQLNRLSPAFDGCDIFYASTEKDYAEVSPEGRFSYIPDASLTSGRLMILWQALCVLWLLLRLKPDVIINRFDHRSPGRTHGHHTGSAMLGVEAFDLVNNPNVFPEQLKNTETWQPKRL